MRGLRRQRAVLPYWDYFRDPVLPAEFTDPASPLYRSDRVHTDVTGALSLSAFSSSLTNFQRGTTNAFEPAIEALPHNGVHNLIGGSMSAVTVSPRDPIFWLHHASIDRLWDGWVYAGGGRHMPSTSSTYWSGSFSYGAGVAGVTRISTYSPSNLGYRYDNHTLPTVLPGTLGAAALTTPTTQDIVAAPLPAQGLSLGGLAGVALEPRSARARVPLTLEGRNRVRSLLTRREQASGGAGDPMQSDPLRIVLDGVAPTDTGAQGGYFYKILLNLPSRGIAQPEQTYLIGTLGPFEIAAAIHAQGMASGGHMAMHGTARIVLPASDVLRRVWPDSLDALTLSFVRVDGGAPRQGTAITIDRMWVEAEY